MWQTCPICDGSGTAPNPISINTTEKCTLCNGHKIISALTGLPPKMEVSKISLNKITPDIPKVDFDKEEDFKTIVLPKLKPREVTNYG